MSYRRMLTSGLLAGFGAGLFAVVLHFALLQDLVLLSEEYETGAKAHFPMGADSETMSAIVGADVSTGEDGSPIRRNILTVLFSALNYSGFGLILVACFALAEHQGHKIAPREGIIWGIAGYLTFVLAPALGLAPELPGAATADLILRQLWWSGTVLATGTGLALLVFGTTAPAWGVAAVLIAAPHIIGAPHPEIFVGVVPPELAGEFAARVLGVSFMVWVVLGLLAGKLWQDQTNAG